MIGVLRSIVIFQVCAVLFCTRGFSAQHGAGTPHSLFPEKLDQSSPKRKGVRLGVILDEEKTEGVWIADVSPDSAAGKAGAKAGDRILKLAGKDIASVEALRVTLASLEELSTQEMVVERDGKEVTLSVVFGASDPPFPRWEEKVQSGPLHDSTDAVADEDTRKAVAAKLPAIAVEFLLKQQLASGEWSVGFQPSPDPAGGASVGATALVCMALLSHYDTAPERIKPAIDRGVEHIRKWVWRRRDSARDFEFTAWGQLYGATLLTRLTSHAAWKDQASTLLKDRDDILEWMYLRQATEATIAGSWGDRNSFHTAAVILGLLEMRSAGANIRKDVVESSAAFLDKLRHDDFSYAYSAGSGEFTDATWNDYGGKGKVGADEYRAKDSMGRVGECATALFRAGYLHRTDLERSVKLFMQHRDFLAAARTLTDKDNPKGIPLRLGGNQRGAATPYVWFFHFAYFYTAQSLMHIEKAKRSEWGTALKKDLLEAMNADGTWTAFEYSYGDANAAPGNKVLATAFSLMALHDIDAALAAPDVDHSKDDVAPHRRKDRPVPDTPSREEADF